MPKVFDCFMFMNEFEHLRIRLEELWDFVDYFILVEGNLTHTGHPKPLYFKECQDEFKEFRGKLIPRVAELPAYGAEPWFGWGREIIQRSTINKILEDMPVAVDDVVLTGDVDEIPKRKAILDYLAREDVCCLEEKNYHYNLNTQLETPTLDPKICRYRSVMERGVADLRYMHKAIPLHVIKDAGWHLSFMGGTDKIIEKMKAYAHYDIREPKMDFFVSRENVEASVRDRKSLFLREDLKYLQVKDYSDLPRRITGNFQHFVDNGWVVDGFLGVSGYSGTA